MSKDTKTDTVTHLPTTPVFIEGRVIQRCAVCGEKLYDSLQQEGRYILSSEDAAGLPTYTVGACVRFRDGEVVEAFGVPPNSDMPEDFCIALVEM